MKKVVYLSMFPLRDAIERHMMIADLRQAGFEVEYWDMSGIYYKHIAFQNVAARDYVRKIKSLGEVKRRIGQEDLKTTLFIAQAYLNWGSLSLFYLLTRLKCTIGVFPLVVIPSASNARKIFEKFKGSIFSAAFWQGVLNLFAKVCRRCGLVKHYDIVFAAGSLTKESYFQHSRVVDINYQDYDRYLLFKDSAERLLEGRYAVYLDEGVIANQDNQIVKNKSMDAPLFYGYLNRFFAHLEAQFGVKVVIAVHPGVKYAKEIFQERQIFEGKTCELVKDADFVISQASLALAYAVLYSKPVVFIYTDEYIQKRPSHWSMISFFSRTLRREAVNISAPGVEGFQRVAPVDPEGYDDYKYTLLTSKKSEAKSSKEIVIKELAGF